MLTIVMSTFFVFKGRGRGLLNTIYRVDLFSLLRQATGAYLGLIYISVVLMFPLPVLDPIPGKTSAT